MAKELFIIRHSVAREAFRGQPDVERELTDSGSIRAMQLANYLKNTGLQADALFSSHAARARATAELLAKKVLKNNQEVIFHEDLYESSARLMLALINGLDNSLSRVIIVGHNPIIPYTAEYLTGETVDLMEPGGVLKLRTETHKWEEVSAKTMDLVEYVSPDVYTQG